MWARILKCCCFDSCQMTRFLLLSLTSMSLCLCHSYSLVKCVSLTIAACWILFFLSTFSSPEKVSCLQIKSTLLAFCLRGCKQFLCTAKNVRFYHARNVLGSCCNLWELVQDISCPWGFNLLSFHHNIHYIFNCFPHIFILHKILSLLSIFLWSILLLLFLNSIILPSFSFKISHWSNPEHQLWVNLT